MSTDQEETKTRIRMPRLSLGGVILLALILGIVTGLFFGELVAPLEQVGIAFIRLAAVIHDIGKIVIPTEILNKKGLLSDTEYGFVHGHHSR